MKRLRKNVFAMALVLVMVMTNTFMVNAAQPQTEAVYDLQKGGTQTSSNKITRAYSPFYSVVIGSIHSAKLVRNSNSKATYSFVYNAAFLNFDTGVRATISGTELKVSKI